MIDYSIANPKITINPLSRDKTKKDMKVQGDLAISTIEYTQQNFLFKDWEKAFEVYYRDYEIRYSNSRAYVRGYSITH